MSTPILATKLYIPRPRPNVVARPRLIEWLNEGLYRKLTLVSAPTGFGKTTLVSEWVACCERPAAWLSLDEGDNDPIRFLAYVVAALRTIAAGLGEGVLAALQSSQPPPAEAILITLLNEIASVPDNFTLVLDDYHVIDADAVDASTSVDAALTFLLEHLPPQMHMVIVTREDPDLPLALLRARGQLTELRIADLRFTPTEAAQFLNEAMGLDLSAEEITALETRTEGWIAGLQLAALSIRGREDVPGFIRAFAGDNRYIVDYLVEEVLRRQPERVRSFLLLTSILDRLSGPLCDAVRFGTAGPRTGQEDGAAMLEALERGNLFVVPLDDNRQWYRYHHLFADVLRAHAMEQQPDQIPVWHQRASEWYEHNGLPSDAIRHAVAAEDFERAASLVELAAPAMRRSRLEATLLGWMKALPDKLVRLRPVLSVDYAFALAMTGQLDAVEPRLRDAERWLDTTGDMAKRLEASGAEMVVVNEEEFPSLPGMIAGARAVRAQARGDVAGAMKHARRALDLTPEGDHLLRGAAAGLLALAYWAHGDLEEAHRTFADALVSLQMAGYIYDVISGTLILADIRSAQGRLHESMSEYEQSLQFAMEQGEPVPRGSADLYVGMSVLHREWGDLEAARQHLLRSKELGERAGLPENRYRWCVAMARIREAEGDLDGALALTQEAERLYIVGFHPNVRPVAALKARIWVMQGRLADALAWAQEHELSVDDDLSYLREFEHITLARVLIARYKSDQEERSIHEVVGLLERLLKAAEEGERAGSEIEILVLQALAHQAQGDIAAALAPLERALTLAEPEDYVRTFVDEGPPMAALLRKIANQGIAPDYVGRLRAAFKKAEGRMPTTQPLIEPLTERELEVLRLLTTELTGPEIARELVVSLTTIRTHTQNIYGKLGVNNRRAAVRRAEELDLL